MYTMGPGKDLGWISYTMLYQELISHGAPNVRLLTGGKLSLRTHLSELNMSTATTRRGAGPPP